VKVPFKVVAPLVAALAIAACNGGGNSSMPGAPGQVGAQAVHIPHWQATHSAVPACAGSRIGQAQCDVLITTGVHPNTAGLSAANLEDAYKLPSTTKGKGASVYIVDAYDNPNVATDFAEYRSVMGLPVGTLNKYNQEGQMSNYPTGNIGWGVEIDLDVEMVSASCPNCTVNLIEANSNGGSDLGASEKEAVALGATIVSNSYTGGGLDVSDYDTPGVTYLASAGDTGYGLTDPAAFASVVAVGGTALSPNTASKRGWNEVVWQDSGGGCSSESKPSWQKDPDCSSRTGADVSAQASGEVAEYDTYGHGGWFLVGGTSVSSPFIGGVFALAGNSTKQNGGENFWKLSEKKIKKDLYYVSSGNDGSCGGEYLCTAGTKQFGDFSGPTGWGTPHGIGAF
jgi:subtilase family serine protease